MFEKEFTDKTAEDGRAAFQLLKGMFGTNHTTDMISKKASELKCTLHEAAIILVEEL